MSRAADRIRCLAQRLFSVNTLEHVIDPAIADLRWEEHAARSSGNRWHYWRVVVRAYWALLKVLAWTTIQRTSQAATSVVRSNDSAIGRLAFFSLAWTAVIVVVLVWPPYANVGQRFPLSTAIRLVWTLVPQGLALALPVGFFFGTLGALRRRPLTARNRLDAVIGATTCALATFVVVTMLVPAANQSFREVVASHLSGSGRQFTPVKGANELTMRELKARINLLEHRPGYARERRTLRESYQIRLALIAAPLALAPLALALSELRRSWVILVASCVLPAWWVLAYIGSSISPAGVWLPNFMVALTALALLVRVRRAGQPADSGIRDA